MILEGNNDEAQVCTFSVSLVPMGVSLKRVYKTPQASTFKAMSKPMVERSMAADTQEDLLLVLLVVLVCSSHSKCAMCRPSVSCKPGLRKCFTILHVASSRLFPVTVQDQVDTAFGTQEVLHQNQNTI